MKRIVRTLLFTCFLNSAHVYAADTAQVTTVAEHQSPRETGMFASLKHNVVKALPSAFHGAHIAMAVANLKLEAKDRYKTTLPGMGLVEANLFYSLLTLGIGSYGKLAETAEPMRVLKEFVEYAALAGAAGAGAYYFDGPTALIGVLTYTIAKIVVAGDHSPIEYATGETHAIAAK